MRNWQVYCTDNWRNSCVVCCPFTSWVQPSATTPLLRLAEALSADNSKEWKSILHFMACNYSSIKLRWMMMNSIKGWELENLHFIWCKEGALGKLALHSTLDQPRSIASAQQLQMQHFCDPINLQWFSLESDDVERASNSLQVVSRSACELHKALLPA